MWYKTGTINLIANNATVMGTGTAWADAKFGVMPGMILLAPDNKLYEVKQVNSNTSLTLNSNYAGSTASGQSYAIITTYEGDISQFSARFAAMLTFFQGSRNDTVSWFTGSGDMTFTKDDGTKLTVPTLAKIQSDSVSRTLTEDQKVASTVLLSKPTRLSSIATIGFTPSTQGAWVSWGRVGAGDTEGYNGATDFINNRGNGVGGWNFWNSNGTTTNLSAKISPNGYLTAVGGFISTGDQVMQAGATTPNLLIRLKDVSGVEKGAVYAQTDTGAMNIRWNGTTNTASFRPDGFVSLSNGLVLGNAFTTIEKVPDLGALPFVFRGGDRADLVHPNNANIATSNGFSVVSTATTGLVSNVTYGTPVFSVNARTGTAQVLNDFTIAGKTALKVGDYGIGKDFLPLVPDVTLASDYRVNGAWYVTNTYTRDAFGNVPNHMFNISGHVNKSYCAQLSIQRDNDKIAFRGIKNNIVGAWNELVVNNTEAQIVPPLLSSGTNGNRYCKIAEQSITTVSARGMHFMITGGRSYAAANPGLDIMHIYFSARNSTTSALASTGLQVLRTGLTSGGNISAGAVYNPTTAMWELWISGAGYNSPSISLIGNVVSGTQGLIPIETSTWTATMPSGFMAVTEKRVWTDFNSTVDANGFLKVASPIVRLQGNGFCTLNDESQGVTTERIDLGVYEVKGSLGFAEEGWNIEVPQDVNGNRLCFVATEAAEDGTITVKVSKRRFDIDTAAIVAGEPMDIPEGRWIDLRLEMPPVEEVQNEPEPESREGEMASE